jgi:hypothetical protein
VRGDHPSWATDRDTEASDLSAPGAREEAGGAGSPDRSAVARRPPHRLERCGRGRVAPGHGVAQLTAAVGGATVTRAGQEKPRPATGPRGPGAYAVVPSGPRAGGLRRVTLWVLSADAVRPAPAETRRRSSARGRPPARGLASPCRGRQGLTRQPGALPTRRSPSAPCRSSRPLPSGAVAGLLRVPPVLRLPSGGHSERSRPAGSGHRGKPGALDRVASTQPQAGTATPAGRGSTPHPHEVVRAHPDDHAPGGGPVSAGRRRW